MNRIIPAGCLAALFLAGCNSPSQHTPVPRNYGAASDVAVNLLRELVRITAQMNWQLNDLKEQIRQGNVISGQQLALTARQYYEKQLGSLEKTINQANAR